MPTPSLHCAHHRLALSTPKVMGILNLTPDSFSDGGAFLNRNAALRQAERMVKEGAAILDIGAESSRPGATPVSVQEELDRLIPLLETLKQTFDIPLSVDTYKPEVMQAALALGVDMINDIRALTAPGALECVAKTQAAVCLMHMQGEPQTMQQTPAYQDLFAEVMAFLKQRAEACQSAGIAAERIVIDPGFGFGKKLQHNLQLMQTLERFQALPYPLLVGVSRKASIGRILTAPPSERLYGSLALAVLAAYKGAKIIRAHDVKPTVEALAVTAAVLAGDNYES